jgi:maleamate amidohydrolase
MDLERISQGLGDRPALLVVDMIRGFTDPRCPLGCEAGEVVAANARLVREFHCAGLPVYFTTVVYRDDSQARVFRARVPALNLLTPESPWVRLDDRLGWSRGDELLEKHWASAFAGTDLDARLKRDGVDSLVVTGLTTSGCVRATVVDGLQHDYRVVVPREAVGDRNAEAHRANLFDMHAKYADVLALEQVIGLLPCSSSAAHG